MIECTKCAHPVMFFSRLFSDCRDSGWRIPSSDDSFEVEEISKAVRVVVMIETSFQTRHSELRLNLVGFLNG